MISHKSKKILLVLQRLINHYDPKQTKDVTLDAMLEEAGSKIF
jgi:hypothetical protein